MNRHLSTSLGAFAAVSSAGLWLSRHRGAAAVELWSPSSLPTARYGPLSARVAGDGDRAVLLLHGLVSTGAIFGGGFDALREAHRIVIPDLLGFGGSLDETRSSFLLDDHLDALDELAERSGIFRYERWTIGAHSMGSVVALAWAARHKDHADRVTCWGAPAYTSASDAESHISGEPAHRSGAKFDNRLFSRNTANDGDQSAVFQGTLMTRLFVLDTSWAERACALSCKHRTAAGWLTAAVEPGLPVPVARAVSLHTWPAYRDAIRDLVIEADWETLVGDASQHRTQIRFVWGDDDPIGDKDFMRSLAADHPAVDIEVVAGADHRLPMTHPARCIATLRLSGAAR